MCYEVDEIENRLNMCSGKTLLKCVKIVPIGFGPLKLRTFKRSGPVLAHPVYIMVIIIIILKTLGRHIPEGV